MAAVAVMGIAKIINCLTSKSCLSFLSAEAETSSGRKDANVSFPSAQELLVFVLFKPLQDLHLPQETRGKGKAIVCVCFCEQAFLELRDMSSTEGPQPLI